MNDLDLLKLRFAGLSTQQIHHLFKFYPSFMSYSNLERRYVLKQFLSTRKLTKRTDILRTYMSTDTNMFVEQLKNWEVQFITINHPLYPPLLREIHDPPLILFYRGKLTLMQSSHTLAIIGSRQATNYTLKTLQTFFLRFKKGNLTIVSGLAKGADSIAHEQALLFNMPTIAVLGFGHMHHYPKETNEIRRQLEHKGLVISEYLPFEKPKKHYFPERNRLISGLSKGVFITESTENSGTSITTNCALEQNREVYVLPGSIYNKMTLGNLQSAQEGAKIVLRAEDILEDFITG
ncbi:DNA-processing protein DprA [Staphylococcus edaphicus]|uniref:DNA-processing protein DprA n=1 Tax=Staphylococcus edaphicus TaxID=1955013 RepID=A0A2C6WRH7_9STAP|nr:DNA-processing protein DprA [Staphylococcus edaphicus]PHK50723.1 DNA-protecting protein DprA [Staphylococcus edaphicus]UQW80609.1 DNA-processing protein DprA [Staphylococcus edaphicus]